MDPADVQWRKTHTSISHLSLDGTSDQSGCKEKRCLHEFTTPATKAAPYKDAFAPWSSAERNAHKLIFRCQFFVLSVCVSMHAEWAASAWWGAEGLFLLVARSLGKPCSCSPLFVSLASLTARLSALREVFHCDFHTLSPRLCLRERAQSWHKHAFTTPGLDSGEPLAQFTGGWGRMGKKVERREKRGSLVSWKCLLLLTMKRRWAPLRADGGRGGRGGDSGPRPTYTQS